MRDTPPLDKPDDCDRSNWTQSVVLCPNCQTERLWSIRLNEGADLWKTKHLECSACGYDVRR